MGQTLYEKILAEHTVKRIDALNILLYVDAHFANEYTSPQAFAGLRERGARVLSPDSHLCVVDHIIPTRDESPRVIVDAASRIQAENLAKNCSDFGIRAFYGPDSPDQGIEHVVMDEQGIVRPGMVVICGDSHTTTHGALGALAFGIGTSEIEHILATECLVYRLAKTMRIRLTGKLPDGSSAKDLALAVLKKVTARGALGYVVEYDGECVSSLSPEERMTLCNLTVEEGARGALIAPDEKTLRYVLERSPDLRGKAMEDALNYWKTLFSDKDARFDKTIVIDACGVTPMVTWGTSPDQSCGIGERVPSPESFSDEVEKKAALRALAYQGLKAGDRIEGTPVTHVFIGSCTNARISDLREAAKVLKGRHIASGVTAEVVPGSMRVRRQAEVEGLDAIFREAGFSWRKSGCSLCLAMNDDVLAPKVRCASTTNRNFEGRQGRASRTHLVSPVMAAAAAVAGCLTDWRKL